MRLHNMFKKTGEKITSIHSRNRRKPEAPEGILKKCNKCGAAILTDEVINGKYICPKCHGYFRIPAYKRINCYTDFIVSTHESTSSYNKWSIIFWWSKVSCISDGDSLCRCGISASECIVQPFYADAWFVEER